MSSKKTKGPRKFVESTSTTVDEEKEAEKEQPIPDHELFLTAFEKPTHIYRYLKTKHEESPIFLHRNLSYLSSYRMSRKKNTRSLRLEYIVEKLKEFHNNSKVLLNLQYIGFFEDNPESQVSSVDMETYLLLNSLENKETKRVLIGNHKIPLNPTEETSKKKKKDYDDVNLYIDEFINENHSCICALQFNVKLASSRFRTRYGRFSKAAKTSLTSIYSNEIMICTNRNNIFLTDGLYEIPFEQNSNKENQQAFLNNNHCQWKSMSTDLEKQFNFSACLRFNLTLTGLSLKRKDTRIKTDEERKRFELTKPIIFRFLYGKYSQKTDASIVPNCPWCTVNCGSLYCLLKHLRCCHDRLSFKYTKTAKEHVINVIVNENFNACQEDQPHEFDFSRSCLVSGPKRKHPFTKILVLRTGQRKHGNMSEFAKFTENDILSSSYCHSNVQPHHRLYNHSVTGIPKYPNEIDIDSEEELDPLWLRDSVTKMVDEFRDVNEGEKEIMKMWNLHVLKHGFVGNCQMELACNMFVEEKGEQILSRNLYRNFVVHMSNLVDYEMISASVCFEVIGKLQEKMKEFSREQLSRLLKPSNVCDDNGNTKDFSEEGGFCSIKKEFSTKK